MRHGTAFVLMLLLGACTPHDPSAGHSSGELVSKLRASFRAATMSAEERQEFEGRARLRELQREQGLRVCEEGEHGTKWQEDCMGCRCEHGRRSCPSIKCTHKRRVKKHPREL